MTSLPPALLELMSRVIRGEVSGEELLRHLDSLRIDPGSPRPSQEHPPHHETSCPDERSSQQERLQPGEAGHGNGVDRADTATETEWPHPAATPPLSGATYQQCSIPGATVDLGRQARCGFGEVVYGDGKPAELIARIVRTQLDVGQSALVTRIDSGVAFQVRQSFPFSHHNPLARTLRVSPQPMDQPTPLTPQQASGRLHAAVVTAGSTDAPVAEEVIETLNWMGVPLQRFEDIGVAGPQRLAAALPALRLASAVVVVAGMEGALPAVVGGHLAVPVFAVPTSVGYGANLGGLTTLMSMLTTCASSVAVVNIDSGFKGGYLAGLVVRQLEQLSRRLSDRTESDGDASTRADQARALGHSVGRES